MSPLFLQLVIAPAVLGNIGPLSFLYGPRCARSVLPRPPANIPQHGPRARLVIKKLKVSGLRLDIVYHNTVAHIVFSSCTPEGVIFALKR